MTSNGKQENGTAGEKATRKKRAHKPFPPTSLENAIVAPPSSPSDSALPEPPTIEVKS